MAIPRNGRPVGNWSRGFPRLISLAAEVEVQRRKKRSRIRKSGTIEGIEKSFKAP
jgi:hypothetical protein